MTRDEARFWSKVDRSAGPDACWPWTASLIKGYGHFGKVVDGKWVDRKSHREAYELVNGPIPAWASVLHSCDNPPCSNPAHLRLGSVSDNAADRVARGRGCVGVKNGRARVTPEQVAEIRASSDRQVDLAARYGLSQTHVSRIKRGENWRYDGYVVVEPKPVTVGDQLALL